MSTFQAPERSREQRMEALALANAIRSQRAELKRQLKRRERSLTELLTAPPEEAQTWHLLDALMACPRVGKVKAQKALRTAGVSPRKTLGGMTDRQANVLLRVLGAQAEMAPDGTYGGARKVRRRDEMAPDGSYGGARVLAGTRA